MIGDSIPWKEDLLRIADRLEGRQSQQRWSGRTSYLVERDVMVGAFAVRKLHEARKVSDEVMAERVSVVEHRVKDETKPPDIWSRWESWEHYDLEQGRAVTLDLAGFCNQIIHSWNWMLSATEHKPHRLDGIYLSSDHKRRAVVYFVAIEALVTTFRMVGNDDVLFIRMAWNEEGERVFSRVSARPHEFDREG